LCESAGTVVMKTIRLQFSDLDPWIFGSDIKVVHLVRDPRAIVHSMQELWVQELSGWGRTFNFTSSKIEKITSPKLFCKLPMKSNSKEWPPNFEGTLFDQTNYASVRQYVLKLIGFNILKMLNRQEVKVSSSFSKAKFAN
jgi:hypothetical protein